MPGANIAPGLRRGPRTKGPAAHGRGKAPGSAVREYGIRPQRKLLRRSCKNTCFIPARLLYLSKPIYTLGMLGL